MPGNAVAPIDKPDIIVPDASPLIHLAQAGALHLLHDIGRAVIIVDIVADEVTRMPTKSCAETLAAWIEEGRRPGSNSPVRVEATETGRAIALARVTDPAFTMRNGSETAIIEWLADLADARTEQVVVLYENGRVVRGVQQQDLNADIDVITTRAFLDLAERRGLIPSAAGAWAVIEAHAPTANPRVQSFSALVQGADQGSHLLQFRS